MVRSLSLSTSIQQKKKLQQLSRMPDFTLPINHNLIIGRTSPGTHHPGGLVLQKQPNEVRKTCIKAIIGASTLADLRLPAWSASRASSSNPVVRIHWTRWKTQHLALEGGLSMSPRARCLSIMERTPLPQPNQPRDEPIDPRLHSLYLETRAYLPTRRGDTGVYLTTLG
ncbi:hypothetical protein B296_00035219 [Ensete ventricosum]|uniref:Uncharacterized protein n=1 Tax=Ensete ventricosum TaxID=4639 RepID=A0A426Z6U2_ENSVE|nr:hypothetical protein B296_00035219 [Ensete ventricosum]